MAHTYQHLTDDDRQTVQADIAARDTPPEVDATLAAAWERDHYAHSLLAAQTTDADEKQTHTDAMAQIEQALGDAGHEMPDVSVDLLVDSLPVTAGNPVPVAGAVTTDVDTSTLARDTSVTAVTAAVQALPAPQTNALTDTQLRATPLAVSTGEVLPTDGDVFAVQPGVVATTDNVSPSTVALTGTSGSPQTLTSFTRDKSVGGYGSWVLRGRAQMLLTPPPNHLLVNTTSIAGSAPTLASTWEDFGTAQAFTNPAQQHTEARYVLTGTVPVGCNSLQNPAGFNAQVRILNGVGGVIGTSSSVAISASSGGTTRTNVTYTLTGSLNALPAYSGAVKLQLFTTSAVGVTVGLGTLNFKREWRITRTLFARANDGTNPAYSSAASSTTSDGAAVTATVTERTISYPTPPFTDATHSLQVYANSVTLPTDVDTGAATMVISAGSSTYLRLEGTVASPFTFTPADFGYTTMNVLQAHLGAGAEYRWADSAHDGVDSTDAVARISGLPDGTTVDLRGAEITKGYLAKTGTYTPSLLVVGRV